MCVVLLEDLYADNKVKSVSEGLYGGDIDGLGRDETDGVERARRVELVESGDLGECAWKICVGRYKRNERKGAGHADARWR